MSVILVAAGERPAEDALSAQLWTVSPSYALEQSVEFAPTALLITDMSDDPAADRARRRGPDRH